MVLSDSEDEDFPYRPGNEPREPYEYSEEPYLPDPACSRCELHRATIVCYRCAKPICIACVGIVRDRIKFETYACNRCYTKSKPTVPGQDECVVM